MDQTSSKLRVVIFAGGIGSRMWPLSRKSTPKQFEKIINNKSTLQLAVERVLPEVDPENIFISTNKAYKDIINQQLPMIKPENIISEPQMRDVAAAVGYLMCILEKNDPNGPVAILWSDHLLENVQEFKNVLFAGAKHLEQNPNKIIFLGQKPRFANQNLGWIEMGDSIGNIDSFSLHEFKSWHYRPELQKAQEYCDNPNFTWNPGYFVVTPSNIMSQFQKHMPEMYLQLRNLQETFGSEGHEDRLDEIYPKLERISFDDAILEKIDPQEAVVIPVDLGWTDVGTWESLKEALQTTPGENLITGRVAHCGTQDSLIYNYTGQLVAGVGLKGMVVVATNDVILVMPQEEIPQVKKLLASFEGTDLERYT